MTEYRLVLIGNVWINPNNVEYVTEDRDDGKTYIHFVSGNGIHVEGSAVEVAILLATAGVE